LYYTCAIIALSVLAPQPPLADFTGCPIVVGADASGLELAAARELAKYERLLSGAQAPIVREAAGTGPAVYVGTPESLPAISDVVPSDLGEQGHVIRTADEGTRLVLAGRESIGAQYAVYSLLERLGVGFYLGGDALPSGRVLLAVPADLYERNEPVLKIRGSLPWYNFLNSPTTWNLEDFRLFFDQMAKMKMNFVGFHAYDSEPFFAWEDDKGWHDGAPAVTSRDYGWGTVRGMKTNEFGFGTGGFFDEPEFGSRATTDMTDADDGIRRAQCLVAQGLEYARQRGIHTCVGFELVGDPTDPANQERYDRRIRYVLSRFPMADYIWFWQSEGLGGGAGVAKGTELDALVRQQRGTFAYLGAEHRIAEAVRVSEFTQFAYKVARRARPDIKIVLSGWGGDQWMRFSDFYVGLDKTLPSDVVFAALDNIDPTSATKVSQAYAEVSPQRERWPIPWFQSDGGFTRRDQWGPQCNAKPFTYLCRDAYDKGCQGLLGIHWETRGVEEVAAYLAQFAWNPRLEYGEFYDGVAARCFGPTHGPEMSAILQELEALGPRWTGGGGQVECGGFSWFSDDRRPKERNLRTLRRVRGRVLQLLASAEPRQRERLQYLLATIDFVTNYDRAALLFAPGGEVSLGIDQAEALAAAGEKERAARLARDLWLKIADSGLREAMQAYERRLTSEGDYGNLATINVKAFAMLEATTARLARVLPPPSDDEPLRGLHLRGKTAPGCVPEGVPLPVRCTAFSDRGEVAVTLRYRHPAGAWTTLAMGPTHGDGFIGSIPGEAVGPEGIEYYVRALDSAGREVTWPVSAPETPFACASLPYAGPAVFTPVAERSRKGYSSPVDGQPLTLVGLTASAVEYDAPEVGFSISTPAEVSASVRYNVATATVRSVMLDDNRLTVHVSAVDATGRRAASPTAVLGVDVAPPSAPGTVSVAVTQPFTVALSWDPASDDVAVSHYEVHRSADADFRPTDATLVARVPVEHYVDYRAPVGATVHYAIVAVDEESKSGPPARTGGIVVPTPPLPTPPTDVKAVGGPERVMVSWNASPTDYTRGYVLECDAGGGWRQVGDAMLAGLSTVIAPVKAGTACGFRVSAVDIAGRRGTPSSEARAVATEAQREPVFEAAFGDTTAGGRQGALMGGARLVDGCLSTENGGWMEFPNTPDLQITGPLSFELWFRPSVIDGIPLLLSFGHFQGDGYWLQIMGAIRYYLPVMEILDCGGVEVGKWQHIAAVYDGATQVLYVDGAEVGRRTVGRLGMTPWPGPLRIGQYSDIDPQFQARGLFDDVRIYQRALSSGEVRQSCEAGRPGKQ